MTSQLLEKGPQTGAEALPEAVYPAKKTLIAKLAEYERAQAELEDYAGRVSRSEIDENRVLEDQELSESEAAERIARAQSERNVYRARQGQREKVIESLKAPLAAAINAALGELRLAVNTEVVRRKEIIRGRLLEALQPGALAWRREESLAMLLEGSAPIQQAAGIAPGSHIYSVRDSGLELTAKDLLQRFERLAPELGRSI